MELRGPRDCNSNVPRLCGGGTARLRGRNSTGATSGGKGAHYDDEGVPADLPGTPTFSTRTRTIKTRPTIWTTILAVMPV